MKKISKEINLFKFNLSKKNFKNFKNIFLLFLLIFSLYFLSNLFTKKINNENFNYENFKNFYTIEEIEHKEKNFEKNLEKDKKRVCIIMTGDENIRSFYEKAINKNLNYAKKHKYDFYALIGRRLSDKKYKPHFDRYQIILDKLDDGYDYVLYIDSDAFIKTQEIKLDEYIENLKNRPNKILLASMDCMILSRKMPINSGVILIKNNKKAKQFCKDVLTLHPEHHLKNFNCTKDSKFFDQCVIEKMKKYHDSFILLPYGKLQKFPSSRANQCNTKSDFSNQEFIFHISGVSDEERLKYLNEDDVEGFSNSSDIETFPICRANQNCYNERINNTKNVITVKSMIAI